MRPLYLTLALYIVCSLACLVVTADPAVESQVAIDPIAVTTTELSARSHKEHGTKSYDEDITANRGFLSLFSVGLLFFCLITIFVAWYQVQPLKEEYEEIVEIRVDGSEEDDLQATSGYPKARMLKASSGSSVSDASHPLVTSDADFLTLATPLSSATLPSILRWKDEPSSWGVHNNSLHILPDAKTDMWMTTHYGFKVDNAPSLLVHIKGDFILTTYVISQPAHQYDQAGLLVRYNSGCWLKTSCEYEPEPEKSRLGAVVTNYAQSDWSTQEFTGGETGEKEDATATTSASSKKSKKHNKQKSQQQQGGDESKESSRPSSPSHSITQSYWLRIRREADDYIIEFSLSSSTSQPSTIKWTQLRMAHLHEAKGKPVQAGLYACSPKEKGYRAQFEHFSVVRGRV